MDSGDIPSEWLVGAIVTLYKNKGDTNDTNNYWGKTLLSCVGKLFISNLISRLTKFTETQAGFRKGYCTIDQIF